MATLPAAFYVILFLALTCGLIFFLFPLVFKALKLPATIIMFTRYFSTTLFLGISTLAILTTSSVPQALAWGITFAIFLCGMSLIAFLMRREALRNLSSGGNGDSHPGL